MKLELTALCRRMRMIWALLLLMIVVSGCWGRRELKNITLVLAVGIDTPDHRQTRLSFQLVKPSAIGTSQLGSGTAKEQIAIVEHSQAQTFFDAIRNTTLHYSRRINFTHNIVIVIGKQAAKSGIRSFLDLMIRDEETRPTQQLIIAAGEASEVLQLQPQMEKVIAMEISNILKLAAVNSKVYPVKLQALMEVLLSKTTAATLPVIRVSKGASKGKLEIDGLAVFKKDRWIGQLTPQETRGMLWVIDKVKSGVVVLKTADGGKIDMEIANAWGRFKPEITKNGLKMKVMIRVETNLGNMAPPKNLFSPAGLAKLARLTEVVVKNEVSRTIHRAKKLNSDIFGFGEAVYRRYPSEWQALEPIWDEVFSDLEVVIEVKAKVRLVGKTVKPI